jgi:hypothetical protein
VLGYGRNAKKPDGAFGFRGTTVDRQGLEKLLVLMVRAKRPFLNGVFQRWKGSATEGGLQRKRGWPGR